jgi:Cu/Ag efflux pump CusA
MKNVREIAGGYPGLRTSVRTYAEDRVAAAQDTVGSELVVRVYGPEFATLRETAQNVSGVLSTVTGVLSPTVEAPVSQPTVEIEVNLAAAQRHGLRPGDVRREASTLISGLTVGNLYEQQKVFDVVVWGGPATRHSITDLEALVIDTPSGGHVRLGDVAAVRIAPNPVAITHNSVSRSLDVTAEVHGRSAAEVAQEVTSRLRGLSLPYEYRAEVLGAAAERQANHRTVALIAVVVALLSLLILHSATGSWRIAGALMVSVPVAVAGGVLVAPLVGGVRSIGVLVALFALLALALRQALVFVRRARELGDAGDVTSQQAVQEALRECAPAVVGGALVTAAILTAPAVMGSTAGLELLHPFAVSMLAGLITCIGVSLVVVPACYLAINRRAGSLTAATPTSEIQAEVK